MNEIEKYYNKFNEDKRLETRHGQIEFKVTTKYLQDILVNKSKILDVGAGTGKYSIFFDNLGHDVTAIELVKKNLSVLKQKAPQIKSFQGNALNLKKFKDNFFDAVLLFGPMYHLFNIEDKIQALNEAKRVTKPNGYIFVAYLLADYAIIRHGFMDNNIKQSLRDKKLDLNFNIHSTENDLYSYVRLPEIDQLNIDTNLTRIKIFSPDGPTDYIRQFINKLDDEDFNLFLEYQFKNAERIDLLGASSHIVDILQKQ